MTERAAADRIVDNRRPDNRLILNTGLLLALASSQVPAVPTSSEIPAYVAEAQPSQSNPDSRQLVWLDWTHPFAARVAEAAEQCGATVQVRVKAAIDGKLHPVLGLNYTVTTQGNPNQKQGVTTNKDGIGFTPEGKDRFEIKGDITGIKDGKKQTTVVIKGGNSNDTISSIDCEKGTALNVTRSGRSAEDDKVNGRLSIPKPAATAAPTSTPTRQAAQPSVTANPPTFTPAPKPSPEATHSPAPVPSRTAPTAIPAASPTPTQTPEPVVQMTGEQLYNQNCVSCHGEDGAKTDKARLLDTEWLQSNINQAYLKLRNRSGIDGVTGGHQFSEILNNEQTETILNYFKTNATKPLKKEDNTPGIAVTAAAGVTLAAVVGAAFCIRNRPKRRPVSIFARNSGRSPAATDHSNNGFGGLS